MRRASHRTSAWCFAGNWAIECLFTPPKTCFMKKNGLEVPANNQ